MKYHGKTDWFQFENLHPAPNETLLDHNDYNQLVVDCFDLVEYLRLVDRLFVARSACSRLGSHGNKTLQAHLYVNKVAIYRIKTVDA